MKPPRPQRHSPGTLKKYPHTNITEKIFSCAIKGHSILGPGLLKNLYEEAMEIEFKSGGIKCIRQKQIEIKYQDSSKCSLWFLFNLL